MWAYVNKQLLIAILVLVICVHTRGQMAEFDLQCLRSSDPTLVQQLRLETVKQEILLRLNLNAEPVNPDPESLEKDKKLIEDEYNAVKKAAELNSANEKPCVEIETDLTDLLVVFPTSVTASSSSAVGGGLGSTNGSETTPHSRPQFPKPQIKNAINDTYQFQFDIDLQGNKDVFSAELRLLKKIQESNFFDVNQTILYDRVEVFLVLPEVEGYYGEDLVLFASAQHVTLDEEGYVVFDVKTAINEWSHENYLLSGKILFEVHIRSPEALSAGITFTPHIQFVADKVTSQLVIRVWSGDLDGIAEDTSRKKRSQSNIQTKHCIKNPDEPQCCLRLLEIDFERDFNWTWIMYPRSIAFNYCSGVCPIGWAITGEHSKFLSLLSARSSRLNNPVAAPSPCCVPNSFYSESIAIKIYPDVTPHIEVLENIVITSCVCR